jgi:hypothetical protein
VLLSAFVAGFFAILSAFVREAAEKAEHDPQHSERLNRLKDYLRMGRHSSVR